MAEELLPQEEARILKALEDFDTPTVTNAVATYPAATSCLGLYSPWKDKWYTDQTLRAMFPELGRSCGYAITCVYGLPEELCRLTIRDVLHAIKDSPQPVCLLIKQDFPPELKNKVGLCGGNMSTAFKSCGCVAILSDGPSRDLEEVRALGLQYMLTGVTAGHGPLSVRALNVPVEICGMEVSPGEIVHMDVNGAVKFPREALKAVYENCCRLRDEETEKMARMASTGDPDELADYLSGISR